MATIVWCKGQLGWTIRESVYCQLIHNSNKLKRLVWAQQYLRESTEGDVISMDETPVQLESHCPFLCRKIGQPSRPKPRTSAMHCFHVWKHYIAPVCDFYILYVKFLCTFLCLMELSIKQRSMCGVSINIQQDNECRGVHRYPEEGTHILYSEHLPPRSLVHAGH